MINFNIPTNYKYLFKIERKQSKNFKMKMNVDLRPLSYKLKVAATNIYVCKQVIKIFVIPTLLKPFILFLLNLDWNTLLILETNCFDKQSYVILFSSIT